VQAAVVHGVKIVSLPGPNAAITALVASGLPTDSFVYLGFPPRKTSHLREFIEKLVEEKRTMVFYESPHRVSKTLSVMREILGDRPAVIARELSKVYEEFIRGRISDLIEHMLENPPRGEITLVVGGMPDDDLEMWDEARVRAVLAARIAEGQKRSRAVKAVSQESGWDRRTLYDMDV
jgi:16S rRNA (cytidine1402-2'-O)-methyltransferase